MERPSRVLPEAGAQLLEKVHATRREKQKEQEERYKERLSEEKRKKNQSIVINVLEDETRCMGDEGCHILGLIICLCIPVLGWAMIIAMCIPCHISRARERRSRVLQAAQEGEEPLNALDFNDDIQEMQC
jgi:hypothetical protein